MGLVYGTLVVRTFHSRQISCSDSIDTQQKEPPRGTRSPAPAGTGAGARRGRRTDDVRARIPAPVSPLCRVGGGEDTWGPAGRPTAQEAAIFSRHQKNSCSSHRTGREVVW